MLIGTESGPLQGPKGDTGETGEAGLSAFVFILRLTHPGGYDGGEADWLNDLVAQVSQLCYS